MGRDVNPIPPAHIQIDGNALSLTRPSRILRAVSTWPILFVFGMVVLMMGANSAFAATQTCAIINGGNSGGLGVSPTYLGNQDGRANEGCNVLITFNADGSITTTNPNTAISYDNGNDDNMVGVINNTGKPITNLLFKSAT